MEVNLRILKPEVRGNELIGPGRFVEQPDFSELALDRVSFSRLQSRLQSADFGRRTKYQGANSQTGIQTLYRQRNNRILGIWRLKSGAYEGYPTQDFGGGGEKVKRVAV